MRRQPDRRFSWRAQLVCAGASLVIFGGLVCLSNGDGRRHWGPPIPQSQFLAELAAEVDGGLLGSGTLDITRYDDGVVSLRYTLDDSTPRLTPDDAEVLTVSLVTSAIRVLRDHGYHPRSEASSISARAYQATPRAGGGGLRYFGSAHYDFESDRVRFEAEPRALSAARAER